MKTCRCSHGWFWHKDAGSRWCEADSCSCSRFVEVDEGAELLAELARKSAVAEWDGGLHARIASHLALVGEAGSSAAAEAVGERQGRQPASPTVQFVEFIAGLVNYPGGMVSAAELSRRAREVLATASELVSDSDAPLYTEGHESAGQQQSGAGGETP